MKATSNGRRAPRFLRQLLSRSTLRKLFVLLLVWFVVEAQLIYYRIARAEHEYQAHASVDLQLESLENHIDEPQNPPRFFLASLHWNNERILRSDWNQQVLDLVEKLGPENVFVSVYEGGSWDDSKGALRELETKLEEKGVAKKIVLDKETHANAMAAQPQPGKGWVQMPDGDMKLRRIPYLSRLRNQSLKPLLDLAENGTTFDYVIFLGDVVFTVGDVIALLNTNHGNFAAACSLDFSKPPLYYDTFALRDSDGHETATQTWPYFRSRNSLNAMLYGAPVPVRSCWNGLVVMPTSAFTGSNGLKFRGIPDSLAQQHLEGSECCLIHADNPASRTRGVFLNPTVRVGYNREAYEKVHPQGGKIWLSTFGVYKGVWKSRFARWFSSPIIKEQVVRSRVRKWEAEAPEESREEPGEFCLINEMQVIVENGWKHL
ncbi:Cryptococcal mannosyltransferase 1 domain containing protein [Naviculisporaceae sp. PSN 640]